MNRPPPATPISLNLAPMVDVMMCLLIFFMLATRMVQQEHSRIDLPQAQAAREVERQSLGNRVVVNVRRGDGGSPDSVEYLLRDQAKPLREVIAKLAEEHRADPEVNCVIRADRDIPFEHVETILGECAGLGVRNITLAALRGEGEP